MKLKPIFATISILGLFAIAGCIEKPQTPTDNASSSSQNNSAMTTTVPSKTNNSPQLAPPVAGDTVAFIETDMGTIKLKLFTEQVPEITKNFMELSKSGKFDNVPFHRVMKNFMIQTGDFTTKNGFGGYSYKGAGVELPDEIVPSLKHLYGTVSMANHGADTNGSQFFIITNKNGYSSLDGGYTIFGQVYEGMDVAEKIADLQTPGTEKPSKEILMKKVTIMPYSK